jgi:opacity protein-like surface antigen
MKKMLLLGIGLAAFAGGSAAAADMQLKAPAVPAPFSWTGWYMGVNGGVGFGDPKDLVVSETTGGAPFTGLNWPGSGNFGTLSPQGWFMGGQFGYNWQAGGMVFGLEADMQGSAMGGNVAGTITPYIAAGNSISASLSTNVDWFSTVRARAGFLLNQWLLYVTGGAAFGGVRSSLTTSDTFGFNSAAALDSTRFGYAVGMGGEYAFRPGWTAKIEYEFVSFSSFNLNATEFVAGAPTGFAVSTQVKPDYQIFRIGFNYHL